MRGARREALRSGFLSFWVLAERSGRGFSRHGMLVYAMALAYRGLFALFPFAILMVALLSFLRVGAVVTWLAGLGPPGLRGPIPEVIERLEGEVLGQAHGGLLVFGILLAFWSVSMGARLLTRALNAVHEVEETRPAWRRIASSVVFAPGIALAGVSCVVLMLVTSRTMAWLSRYVGLDEAFVFLWSLLRVPVALVLLALVVSAVYRFAPDTSLPLRSVLPGAVLAVTLWALASLAFSLYLSISAEHDAIYGGLGTAISLLLYLYVSAIVLLFGAELNVAIRHHSTPYKKRPR